MKKECFDLSRIRSQGPMRTKPACYHRANTIYDVTISIYIFEDIKTTTLEKTLRCHDLYSLKLKLSK
jgi:hypothetical protein